MVISTATLALQAQIVGRDVPRLLKSLKDELPREMDVALVKGRSNYVCQYKLGGGYPDEDEDVLFSLESDAPVAGGSQRSVLGTRAGIVRLRLWAERTDTGDRDDITPGVSDAAWRQVSVSAMDCLGSRNARWLPIASARWPVPGRPSGRGDHQPRDARGLGVRGTGRATGLRHRHHRRGPRTSGPGDKFGDPPLSVDMVQTAASAARKHCAVSVDALNQGAKALQRSLEGVPTGLMARG